MKKILLISVLTANSFLSLAQTSFPNGGFENWSITDYCGSGDSLNYFSSDVGITHYQTLINFNDGNCPDVESQIKSTDAYSGNYALRLGPLIYDQISYDNKIELGSMKIVNYPRQSLKYVETSGMDFTGRPTKLTGYYKFTQGANTDELLIDMWGTTANQDIVFIAQFRTSTPEATYTKFELLIPYTSLSALEILNIRINAGNISNNSMDPNSVVFIDDLAFEYDQTTGNKNASPASPINVYAVNKNINFSENVSDVNVVDMVGTQKINAADAKTLNAASLTAGMYIVTYKYNNAYFSKKIVIE